MSKKEFIDGIESSCSCYTFYSPELDCYYYYSSKYNESTQLYEIGEDKKLYESLKYHNKHDKSDALVAKYYDMFMTYKLKNKRNTVLNLVRAYYLNEAIVYLRDALTSQSNSCLFENGKTYRVTLKDMVTQGNKYVADLKSDKETFAEYATRYFAYLVEQGGLIQLKHI